MQMDQACVDVGHIPATFTLEGPETTIINDLVPSLVYHLAVT